MRLEIQRLLDLPPNWDTYGAPPIDPVAAHMADRLLDLIGAMPAHQAVPTSGGGVQLEWHRGGIHAEVEAKPDGTYDVWWVWANDESDPQDYEEAAEFTVKAYDEGTMTVVATMLGMIGRQMSRNAKAAKPGAAPDAGDATGAPGA